MQPIKYLSGLIIFIFLCVLYSSFYTVQQGEQAIVLRLGKIIVDSDKPVPIIKNPGLHIKFPFIDTIQWFDMRLQSMNVDSSRILTAEQKYVIVDYYAKWRIKNIPLYYTRTGGDADQARVLLQQKINNGLRAEFGRRLLSDVISDDRAAIMTKLQSQANINAQQLGLDVTDVRIKRIDLPEEVSSSVFDRMRAERELVAAKHRADGKAAAEKIQAEADAQSVIMVAKAQALAAKIRGDAEAQAAKIYAEAYSKDPEFYKFYRSLDAYKAIFNPQENNILVLKPDNAFFQYFNQTALNKRADININSAGKHHE